MRPSQSSRQFVLKTQANKGDRLLGYLACTKSWMRCSEQKNQNLRTHTHGYINMSPQLSTGPHFKSAETCYQGNIDAHSAQCCSPSVSTLHSLHTISVLSQHREAPSQQLYFLKPLRRHSPQSLVHLQPNSTHCFSQFFPLDCCYLLLGC
jgi:hypothetical protein